MPDKDADGLDAGVILFRTLETLGLRRDLLDVHLLEKHNNVHDESERRAMQAKNPRYILVVDHGSIEAPPIVDSSNTKSLVIDHHLSDKFPKDAMVGASGLDRKAASDIFRLSPHATIRRSQRPLC